MMRSVLVGLSIVALAGCEVVPGQKSIVDRGFDSALLEDGRANIWIDPDGCQHWWIDDGVEGYMSPRLNRDGTPRCQDERNAVTLKDGTVVIADPEPTNPV
ncbi:hypothetical protein [Yoonia sp.]|uniref:hypothetical protein n=1 Tax=Yoonia sp. TaxID=2212373 RepID=UPI0019F01819|nr:hypothetical protein [Yoonia sp.]MBE0412184.1 hypothetical protein [Yoonia sp.]